LIGKSWGRDLNSPGIDGMTVLKKIREKQCVYAWARFHSLGAGPNDGNS
jgi:hypothetical protein